MNWFNAKEIKPKLNINVLCYCPDWCESEYQVAHYNGDKFVYDSQPNDNFNDFVQQWQLIYEVD